ncbi:MAG: phage integrase SAM-like domain-containing protein [Alistipes indistinctus]
MHRRVYPATASHRRPPSRDRQTLTLASDITGTYKLGGDNRYVDIFAEHVARELENAGRFGTARSYRSLRSAWVKFADRRQWRFSQLDGGTVSAFAAYLESRGRKRNTVTFYLRTLHALYNRARVYGCAPIHRDPFPNVSFKPARTPKLAVNRSLPAYPRHQ